MHQFAQLFSSDFLPHGTCYLWNPKIVWLHVISDAIITLSYYCIPLALIYLIRKRRDLPFNWIFWMFGLFILGCGTTHLMEVWTVWHPTYFLAGTVKAITAAVSIATAIVLVLLLPKAIALPTVDELYGLNRELERDLDTRARREQELTQLIEKLERGVKERTAELESINKSLEREIAIGIDASSWRWAVAGTVVALLTTAFMGVLCWESVVKSARHADWVAHTQEVRRPHLGCQSAGRRNDFYVQLAGLFSRETSCARDHAQRTVTRIFRSVAGRSEAPDHAGARQLEGSLPRVPGATAPMRLCG